MSYDEQPDGDLHGECAAEIHKLEAERDALRGAMAADDERLRSAERRVWADDMTWGCDAADHLADSILDLRAELATLKAEVEALREVERSAERYEKAHAGMRVRFQTAGLANEYEEAAREFSAALDRVREGGGSR